MNDVACFEARGMVVEHITRRSEGAHRNRGLEEAS